MKNYTKKIIVGIFALVFLFSGSQDIFAASLWNGATNDCKGISIVNATTNEGYSNPCWPSSSVSANTGETLNVRIYYHNTGTITATNTRLILNAPTSGSSTTKTFSGTITSDQGNLSLGSVVANLSSSQTITFNSVKWYTENTKQTVTTLLGGQSGSEIIGGGLYIGSIAPGWATQGSVVVSFRVGNTTDSICRDSSATNYLGALPCTYSAASVCSISSFTVEGGSSVTIDNGDEVNLKWNTNNCDHVNITNLGSVNDDGDEDVSPDSDTTYVLTAYNTGGVSNTRSVRVLIDDDYDPDYNKCTITDFDADDTSIEEGDETTLTWKTNNCDHVNISGVGSNLSEDGDEDVSPDNDTTYTLRAYDDDGDLADTDTVEINIDGNSNSDCSISSFKATDTSIDKGDSTTLKWNTNDCDEVTLTGYNEVDEDGSQKVSPTSDKTYILKAYLDGDLEDSASIKINVDEGNNPVNNSDIVTTIATNITTSSATLNGYITDSNYYNSNVYFEYGKSVNLGSRTSTRTTNGNSTFSDYISGLSPYTIYYFRAVSIDGAKGKIEIFRTLNTGVITQKVIVQGTTVAGTDSPIMLKIDNRYQSVGIGDIIDYTVIYENISKKTLTDSVLQVVLPLDVEFTNSSEGTYSVDTNILTVDLKDLAAGEDGVVYVQGKVISLPENSAQIVTTAILVYTNPNDAQENAMAYVLNNPKEGDNSLLGASAFFAGLSDIGLVGWLFIILLILLLVLIARSLTRKPAQATVTTH